MNSAWYLSRAAGLVLYLLLFFVVVLGLSIRTRSLDRVTARWRVTDLHLFLALLALGFVLLHAGSLLWDKFVGYSARDILVPFSTHYRSLATGTGILSAYLMAVVAASFPARRWIGYRAWRALHYGTFAGYLGGLTHGVFAGTDSRLVWAQLLYLGTGSIVLGLVVYRVILWKRRELGALEKREAAARKLPGRRLRRGAARELAFRREATRKRALMVGAACVAVAGFLFLAAGLGPFNWLRLAGTEAREADDEGNAGVLVAAQTSSGFTDTFTGAARSWLADAANHFTLTASAQGQVDVRVDVQIEARRDDAGRAQITANHFVMSSPEGVSLCDGSVRQLSDVGLTAVCNGFGPYRGEQLRLVLSFPDGLGNEIRGTLQTTILS